MNDILLTFGRNLKKALKNRGLKSKDAAQKLGISTTYMSQLVRGEKTPSFEMIVNISEKLRVSPCQLFDDQKPPELERLIYIASQLPANMIESLTEVAQNLLSATGKAATGGQ